MSLQNTRFSNGNTIRCTILEDRASSDNTLAMCCY